MACGAFNARTRAPSAAASAPRNGAVRSRASTRLGLVDVGLLRDACAGLGVNWAGPVAQLAEVTADVTVIANGIDAPALWPGLPVRPVKGEVLRLRWRTHTPAGRELTAAAEAAQLPILTPPVPKRQAIADATETARGLDEGDAQSRDLAVIYAAHIDQLMKGTAHV